MRKDYERYKSAMAECDSKNGESAQQTCKDQVNAYVSEIQKCEMMNPDNKKRCEGEAEYKVGTTICENKSECPGGENLQLSGGQVFKRRC
jgi:hypothetical protein